jgi:hypothetical protein
MDESGIYINFREQGEEETEEDLIYEPAENDLPQYRQKHRYRSKNYHHRDKKEADDKGIMYRVHDKGE